MTDLLRWVRAEWDRAAGVALIVAGAGCLAVGYAGAAGATYVPQALSFIASGGLFGLLLVVVGATLLITAALHDEWRKLDRIEKAIDRLAESGESAAAPSASVVAPSVRPEVVVASPGESAVLLAVDSRRVVAVAAGGLAAAALVAGGWGATASAVTDTTAYSTVRFGIAGVVLAAAVSAAWTLSLRRVARARRSRLLAPFAAVVAESTDRGVLAPFRRRRAGGHRPGADAFPHPRLRRPRHAGRPPRGRSRCRPRRAHPVSPLRPGRLNRARLLAVHRRRPHGRFRLRPRRHGPRVDVHHIRRLQLRPRRNRHVRHLRVLRVA